MKRIFFLFSYRISNRTINDREDNAMIRTGKLGKKLNAAMPAINETAEYIIYTMSPTELVASGF